MILLELTEKKQKIFKSRFKDVKKIVDQLDKADLYYICNGEFKDSPYVVYRDIKHIGSNPVGFIDVYAFDKRNMYIVLAVLKEHRGKGIAKELVRKMERDIDVESIKYLVWKTDRDNTASQKLARQLGYTLYHYTKISRSYMKPNPSYKK